MAMRRIGKTLIVCGGQDMEPRLLDEASPDLVLRLDGRVPTAWANCKVVDAFIADEATPTAKDIKLWLDTCIPPLAEGKCVLIASRTGQNRACSVGALVKCVHEKKKWKDTLDELHELFLKQGHNWWPYDHWEKAFTRHWREVVQPAGEVKKKEIGKGSSRRVAGPLRGKRKAR